MNRNTLQEIATIEKETFGKGVTLDTLGSILKTFKEGLLVLYKNKTTVGYIGWEKHLFQKFPPYNHNWTDFHDPEGKLAYISIITVQEQFRNRGYGSQLLSLIEEKAKNHQCTKLYCPVNKKQPYLNKGVLRFWEKNGFTITGETLWELAPGHSIDSYIFSKKIKY